ncbi:lipoate--protein ligase family protein [Coriobacteriia bacterium Es71-Z0120]|uniref:lipoate--protein ligase family protein n=1 Tax=Parvivirga hydrogeniphila TaxID=2939460 RepID=UPI002260A01A|nr:lipoate--protein ligase family protein [Parvivirga hydrogeniphila]MCL4079663.1 lipoate--protein ligase family protein [Parvivirga hydrogeniphila]
MKAWRLILDGACDGAWNMAVDAAMLAARARGEAPPTLRLYRWSTPTVSLGKFQSAEDLDADAVRGFGVEVVRRPTGGRGVLHDDELTYSVIAGVEDGIPRGVVASYRLLSRALAEAYRRLGVPAEITARPRGNRAASACYLHATHADLSLGAAKLSGSAQVWLSDACLQHGSFVRSRDVGREAAIFRLDPAAASQLAATTATLADVLGDPPDTERIAQAVQASFEQVLGVAFEEAALTEAERAEAERTAASHAVRVG